MWEAVVQLPHSQTTPKNAQGGEASHRNPPMPAFTPNAEWCLARPWAKVPSGRIRDSRALCSRDMSPICSDTSDTEPVDRNSWALQQGGLMVPPPPPPPPPDQPLHTIPGGSSNSSIVHAMHIACPQQPPKLAIPLPPAEPPNGIERPQASQDSEMPPTPPWRKRQLSSSHDPSKWEGLPRTAHFFPWGKEQQQPGNPHPHSSLSSAQPLADPYALSGGADPYAHATSYTGNKLSSAVNSPGAEIMQQLEPVAKLTASAPLPAASESCAGVSNNVPLLLPPPLPHKMMAHAHAPTGRPSYSNYAYHPVSPSASTRGREHWLPPEAHRMRHRLRARHRPEGIVAQGGSGGLPPFPFSPHCYYPPQQHPQQQPQPDRALLALRRTCYRCRKRGHEASECPNGQGLRQMRLDT